MKRDVKEEKMLDKRIGDFLNGHLKSNRVLLIEGPWGCGKTYAVNQYIKSKPIKGCKFIYESLFGVDSLSEVQESIYKKSHRFLNILQIIIKVFSFIAGLFGFSLETTFDNKALSLNLDFSLGVSSKRTLKKIKPRYVVVIDDVERVTHISMKDIFGLVERLALKQYRVVMICNEKEIESAKEFDNFKEKVIDREFHIVKIDSEIIKNFFPNISFDISNYYEELRNNYRLCKKINDLYESLILAGKKINKDLFKYYSEQTLFEYSVYIIAGLYTDNYVSAFLKYLSDNKDDSLAQLYGSHRYEENWIDEELANRINAIHYFNSSLNSDVIANIIDFYLHNKVEPLKNSFDIKESLLIADYYLMSDDELSSTAERQVEMILKETDENPSIVLKCVLSLISWEPLTNVTEHIPNIKAHFICNYDRYKDAVINEHFTMFDVKKEIFDFINDLKQSFEAIEKDRILSNLKSYYFAEEYEKFSSILYDIQSDPSLYEDNCFKASFLKVSKDNKFFLDLLKGHIPNHSYRKMVLEMRNVCVKIGLNKELKEFIENEIAANSDNQMYRIRLNALMK